MAVFSLVASAVVSAATAIGGILGAGSVAGGLTAGAFVKSTVGGFLLRTAVGVGLNLVASAIAGRPRTGQGSSRGLTSAPDSGGEVPRSFVIGDYPARHSIVWWNDWGKSGDTPNAFRTVVYALQDLPAQGLLDVIVADRKVTLDVNAHPEFGRPSVQHRRKGKDNLWIKFYDGTQTTADSFLVNKASSPDRPYQSTRVGVGVAYVIVTARADSKIFSGWPSFMFVLRGIRMYDIASDSSQGGTGVHRWSAPATWGGDGYRLPAVQVYNILRGIKFQGKWFYGGQTIHAGRLPSINWQQQIRKCRLQVAKAPNSNETMNQFETGLVVDAGSSPLDTIEELLAGCVGRVPDTGAHLKLYVGEPSAPVVPIHSDTILSTEDRSLLPSRGLNESVNGIAASFVDPEQLWRPNPIKTVFDDDAVRRAHNMKLVSQHQLTSVTNAVRAQAVVLASMREALRERRHSFTLPSDYWTLEPGGDIISFTSSSDGETSKQYIIDGCLDQPTGDIMVELREFDPSDYDFDIIQDYIPPAHGAVDTWVPPVQPAEGFTVSPDYVLDGQGRLRGPAIKLAWPKTPDDVTGVEYWVRLSGDTNYLPNRNIIGADEATSLEDMIEVNPGEPLYDNPGNPVILQYIVNDELGYAIISEGIRGNVDYEVQAAYVVPGRARERSEWMLVRTHPVGVSELDLDPPLAEEIRARREALEALATELANVSSDLDFKLANWEEKFGTSLVFRAGAAELVLADLLTGEVAQTVLRARADTILLEGTVAARHAVFTNTQNEAPDNQMQDAAAWSEVPSSTGVWSVIPLSTAGFSSRGEVRYTGAQTTADTVTVFSGRNFSVDAGKPYVFRFQTRRLTGTTMNVSLRVDWRDKSGHHFESVETSRFNGTTPGVLTIEEVYAAPANAAQASVEFIVYRQRTNGSVAFGGLYIKKQTGSVEISDGALLAEHVTTDLMDALRIHVDQLIVDRLLRLEIANAGFSAGKVDAEDFYNPGLYLGTNKYADNTFALLAGRVTAEGTHQYIRILDGANGGLRITNSEFGKTTVEVNPPVHHKADLTYTIPVNMVTILQMVVVGGGGGGSSGGSFSDEFVPGVDGNSTVVELFDGAVTTGIKWTALGGMKGRGARLNSDKSNGESGKGEVTLGGVNGRGGMNSLPAQPGTLGGGGGGGYCQAGYGDRGGEGGTAGEIKIIQNIDLTPYANPKLKITCGFGGAGGFVTRADRRGAAGGRGHVHLMMGSNTELSADVLTLEATHKGSFVRTANVAGSFPNLGPGYWEITTKSDLALALGEVKVGPAADDVYWAYGDQSASFVAQQTPTYPALSNATRTIYYRFRSMGSI